MIPHPVEGYTYLGEFLRRYVDSFGREGTSSSITYIYKRNTDGKLYTAQPGDAPWLVHLTEMPHETNMNQFVKFSARTTHAPSAIELTVGSVGRPQPQWHPMDLN